ncbi:hypothetical protein SAMN05444164_0801 [Bradyrhizobium erythrophlei]|uniref:Uncharacterized protein n=1 Tax=Bradyrhizobium erythrophlei TaxID=1437360 RepID=A0A1H4P1R2_9BRAD|nr:hypothetical protein SAMN05444164_0801 [Bradyrhizobium erythrophlei]
MPLMPSLDIAPQAIAEAFRTPSPYRPLILDVDPQERWPCMVRYDQRGTVYVPRELFQFEPDQPGPSDCVWIVPGTTP